GPAHGLEEALLTLGSGGIGEHDHVESVRLAEPGGELVHHHPVVDLNRRDHRLRGDVEGLDQEGFDQHRDDQRGEEKTGDFAPERARLSGLFFFVGFGLGFRRGFARPVFRPEMTTGELGVQSRSSLIRAGLPALSRRWYRLERRTSPRRVTSIFWMIGACTGKMRSTPTPKLILRTVNVSLVPSP